jgi:hypothetical protein
LECSLSTTQHVSALKVCGVLSVDHMLDQHLIMPEEEELAEHKTTFLDALKGQETARKYICQFDTKNNIVTCTPWSRRYLVMCRP